MSGVLKDKKGDQCGWRRVRERVRRGDWETEGEGRGQLMGLCISKEFGWDGGDIGIFKQRNSVIQLLF